LGLGITIPVEAQNIVSGNHELGSFTKMENQKAGTLIRKKRSLTTEKLCVDFIDISL